MEWLQLPPSKLPELLNPLALAYMGDAVYEMYIRQYVISLANHRPNHMHKHATQYVSAKAQAKALDRLMPILTDEEKDMVRRGRNAKSGSSPKNTDILVYRHSTGFECMIGYLYYKGQHERLNELLGLTLTK
jgi:ribonuclease-3 family protein